MPRAKALAPSDKGSNPGEREVLSIGEFCQRFGVSRATLYNEWRAGRGPAFFHVNARRYISLKAARDWVGKLEAEQARGAG
jgi:predicted DNA-binding transcriptional regulator AlpA